MADGRYVTVDALKQFLRDEITFDAELFGEAIAAAELYLDTECQRKFVVADTVASARTYAPERQSIALRIHDCTEITSVVENGVTLTVNVDYTADEHQVAWSGESRPISMLRRYATFWYCDGGLRTVTVTAKWGWAAIPAGAKISCKVAAKAYIEARDVRFGLAGMSEAGGVREREAKAVADFIGNYRGLATIGIAG